MYLGCFSIFTLTSLLCGIATSAQALILSRILPGAAGGLLAPMAQMMIASVAGRHIARAMSIAIMPLMIDRSSTRRWIFLINLAIGALATGLAYCVLPDDNRETVRRPFDQPGFLLLWPGIALLRYVLDWLNVLDVGTASSGKIDAELGLAPLLLAGFFLHAKRRGTSASIDLKLFRNRTFAAAAGTPFFGARVLIGSRMLFPLYLLSVGGRAPAATGSLLAPAGIGLLFVYPMLGGLIDRFGLRRVSSSGALIALLATRPFGVFDASVFSVPLRRLLFLVLGVG